MREMKDSGIEWIGEIPDSWKISKISYFVSLFTGNSISHSEKESYEIDEGFPYIATKDINAINAIANYDNGMRVPFNSNFKIAQKGSTLLCIEGGSAGKKITFLKTDVAFVNKLCAFYSTTVNNKYLYYFIFSDAFVAPFNLNITGLIGGVSLSQLNKFQLVLPTQNEQRIIANFLDDKCQKIDRLIALQEQMIEELKAYKQSVITEAVTKGLDPTVPMKDSGIEWIGEIPEGWTNCRLKQFFDFGKGLSITREDLREFGIEVISYGQIHSKANNGVDIHSSLIRYVENKYIQTNQASLTKKFDFIFADTSEDLEGCGNCVYVNEDRILFAGYHTIILKSRIRMDNKYIAYLFKTDIWRAQIRCRVSGIKLFSITNRILKDASIILPTSIEQKQIVDYLDKKCADIDSLISIKQSKINELKEYKKSMIYEYVTGKKEIV